MNWYKFSNKESKIKKWMKDHPDDGIEAWTRRSDVFLSIGDWAHSRLVEDLEQVIGQDVEYDYEVGSPGFDWVKVQ